MRTTSIHARLTGMALLCVACAAPPDAGPPNVVLIYADDLGWRDLSIQGSRYYETPYIDRLAAEGMRFTHAYANAPNCAPSRAALLSGQYAPRTGIYTVGSAERGRVEDRALMPVDNATTLELEVVTLAEALTNAGYVTGHVGKWHLGGNGFLPRDQGFSWSVAGDASGSPPGYFFPYVSGDRAIPGLEDGSEGEYLTDRLVDEALAFIEQEKEGPFFLYLSHYSVHTPIEAKPELVERYRRKAPSQGHVSPTYAAMIESLDEGVGRILDTLDRLALTENTVVIFASDNGGFGPVTSMAPLRGSKGMLYEGGIRTPLIIRWPGLVSPGSTTAVPVMGTDLYPTLVDMAGAELPGDRLLDGASLVPVLLGSGEMADRDLVWHFPAYLEADRSVSGAWRTTPASALRRGPHKIVHFFEDDRWELYDLVADPSESNDLSERSPQLTRELRTALEHWWSETNAFVPRAANPDYRAEGIR